MDINFTYEDLTQAFFGCAAILGNETFYFGGVGADSNQVSDCLAFYYYLLLFLVGQT